MGRSGPEVADIFRRHGGAYREKHGTSLSNAQRSAMTAIERCRTASLGGHVEQCDNCGEQRVSYNSCRDRSCPKCQSLARAQWIEDRQAELLDTQYFHVVFTVPKEIAAIALQNANTVYNILFHTVAETLQTIAADPQHLGAEIGFFSVLHTWEPNAFRRYLDPVRRTNWVVFAKPPFAGPEKVLDYVGRYTHRVAISNNRLLDIEEGNVRFRWKDYRNGNQQKTMTLSADEFIRRFLLHVLPDGFQQIRYYGFLGNRYRKEKLARCRELLGMTKPEPPEIAEVSETIRSYQDLFEQLTGICLWECPACHQGRMVCIEVLNPVAASPQVIDTS